MLSGVLIFFSTRFSSSREEEANHSRGCSVWFMRKPQPAACINVGGVFKNIHWFSTSLELIELNKSVATTL